MAHLSVSEAVTLAPVEADLYRFGREMLGEDANGLVAELIFAYGDVPGVREMIRCASEDRDPPGYIKAMIALAAAE